MDRVRQRCSAVFAALQLPDDLDVPGLLNAIRLCRGRPVHVHPWKARGGGGPSGLWISLGDSDHIFFEESTSPVHQTQIVLHECAHMLFDHGTCASPQLLKGVFPDLGDSLIRRALARTGYEDTQEAEAELLAKMLLQRILGGARGGSALDRGGDGVTARLERSLSPKVPRSP